MDEFLGKNQNKTRLLRWVGSISALVLLIYLFRKQGWAEIWSAFQQISLARIGLSFLLVIVSRLAVVGRWHSLLSTVERVTWRQSIRITFAGMFATNFLPTTIGGDVIRLAGAVQLGISAVVSAASLVVDRLVGMFGMVLALPFGAKPLLAWLAFLRESQVESMTGISLPWIAQLKEKGIVLLGKILGAVRVWSEHPSSLLRAFIFTLVHMLCLFSTIMLLLDDMGDPISFGMVAGLWSFVYFVTLMPISINGYGVQEISMAYIYSEVGGVSLQSALTVSVLLRTLMMLGSLPGAIFLPGIIASKKGQGEPGI